MRSSVKFWNVLLALVVAALLAACAPAATAPAGAPATDSAVDSAAAPADAGQAAADSRYPAETIKICVETFDPADTQYQGVQQYLNSLAEQVFNVEYIYSEKIESPEQEIQFIENCAAAGAKGFIAYYNVSKAQAVAKATELQMYYWGTAEESDVYEANKTNPYYLGSVTLGSGDYDGMYAVTKAVLDQGRTRLVFANGGADFGVTMFVNRKAGFQAAVDEAKSAGKTIEVTEVPGFPNESWFAAQGAALAKDIDAVVTSFSADVWVQPIAAANKTDQVIVGAFGAITDFYQQAFDSGLVSAIAAEPTERFGIAVAQIVNAVDGNAAALQDGGAPTNLPEELWVIKSKDEFAKVATFEAGDGRMEYSKGLTQLVKNLNGDASVDTLKELIQAYSLQSILQSK